MRETGEMGSLGGGGEMVEVEVRVGGDMVGGGGFVIVRVWRRRRDVDISGAKNSW